MWLDNYINIGLENKEYGEEPDVSSKNKGTDNELI